MKKLEIEIQKGFKGVNPRIENNKLVCELESCRQINVGDFIFLNGGRFASLVSEVHDNGDISSVLDIDIANGVAIAIGMENHININDFNPRFAKEVEIERLHQILNKHGFIVVLSKKSSFLGKLPKKGELAIFWDDGHIDNAIVRLFNQEESDVWDNAIKFENKEQFEKLLNL